LAYKYTCIYIYIGLYSTRKKTKCSKDDRNGTHRAHQGHQVLRNLSRPHNIHAAARSERPTPTHQGHQVCRRLSINLFASSPCLRGVCMYVYIDSTYPQEHRKARRRTARPSTRPRSTSHIYPQLASYFETKTTHTHICIYIAGGDGGTHGQYTHTFSLTHLYDTIHVNDTSTCAHTHVYVILYVMLCITLHIRASVIYIGLA